jgi:hypothetical protein
MGSLLLLGVRANWNNTSTGIDLDKLPHPRLVKILSGGLNGKSRATFDGITATETPGGPREVRLRGASKAGKPWDVRMCCLDEVWRADLDGNGTQDYVFFSTGPYFNGRTTPVFSLSILLMDKQGLPVPFFTLVYQGEHGSGIKNLVDLDRDGRAELLISTYDEYTSDPRVGGMCSGHWVTQLYRFRQLRAEEVRGVASGLHFPFIQAWTYGTDCGATEQPLYPVEAPTIHEHGTSIGGQVSTVIRGEVETGFKIRPDGGCETVSPTTVVSDGARIRKIAFVNLWSSSQNDLIRTIRNNGGHIQLSGLERIGQSADCRANLLWANQVGDH